jgi:hypothetical protein
MSDPILSGLPVTLTRRNGRFLMEQAMLGAVADGTSPDEAWGALEAEAARLIERRRAIGLPVPPARPGRGLAILAVVALVLGGVVVGSFVVIDRAPIMVKAMLPRLAERIAGMSYENREALRHALQPLIQSDPPPEPARR